uniref:Macaca fascicularis brain cDNA clone: QflA-18589, similar to human HSPC049 protein (HSPC049), mRNA, RefSeq: NM_014149.2 n=1 Tax=Macaca fascicularis TaxID=9541 RepID=I7GLK4_MACFA|nr:unnamed protein product [Macaca fascicularis]
MSPTWTAWGTRNLPWCAAKGMPPSPSHLAWASCPRCCLRVRRAPQGCHLPRALLKLRARPRKSPSVVRARRERTRCQEPRMGRASSAGWPLGSPAGHSTGSGACRTTARRGRSFSPQPLPSVQRRNQKPVAQRPSPAQSSTRSQWSH